MRTIPFSFGVSRLTSLVLGLVVFVCLVLIGFSGYLKYQLDRAELDLTMPESALTSSEDAPQKLGHELGYSGFMGSAQTFLASHTPASLEEMKAEIKNAQDVLARLPERTSPEIRHDLHSIFDLYATAAKKADQSTKDTGVSFTATDMAPLYAALPVLDNRIENAVSADHFTAESDLKLWSTLLTLITWGSLIAAAACAAGYYVSLRGRNAAPFRALAQSVQNMARGDMRTPIWGMERQDVVGDLARAIDLARYHFSQLPDMSLLSEQGPIRIRFEGQARSLFEAMMQSISRDAENIRGQASHLTEAVSKEKEAVVQVVHSIESALAHMYQDRVNSEQQVQLLLQTISSSAQTLAGAQYSAEAQLGHLIAYLEERAKGMAEVTHIAGKHVAQTLQSLSHTEQNLRSSAEQNQQTVKKLASSTDELGERLFGAVTLLRAGGKVLNETAEETQARLNEAIGLLGQSENSLRQILAENNGSIVRGPTLENTAVQTSEINRLQSIIGGLEMAQKKLEESLAQQGETTGSQIQILTTHSNTLLAQASSAQHEDITRLHAMMSGLESAQKKLEESLAQQGEVAGTHLQSLTTHSNTLLAQASVSHRDEITRLHALMSGLENAQKKLEESLAQQGDVAGSHLQTLAAQSNALLAQASSAQRDEISRLQALMDGLESTQKRLEQNLAHQGEISGTQLQTLTNHSTTLLTQASSAQNDEITRLHALVSGLESAQRKLEESLAHQGEAAGSQIQMLTTQSNALLAQATTAAQTLANATDHLRHEQGNLGEAVAYTKGHLSEALEHIGHRIEQRMLGTLDRTEKALQGLARLSDLATHMGTSVERLAALEPLAKASTQTVDRKSDNLLLEIKTGFELTTSSIDRLRSEFVSSALDTPAVSDTSTSAATAATWAKMVEQINAANASLATSIAEQADRLERRLTTVDQKISATGNSPEEAQAQLKQQAQVLSELATALGAIDAHMQEMSTTFKTLTAPHGPGSSRMAS